MSLNSNSAIPWVPLTKTSLPVKHEPVLLRLKDMLNLDRPWPKDNGKEPVKAPKIRYGYMLGVIESGTDNFGEYVPYQFKLLNLQESITFDKVEAWAYLNERG